MMNIANFQCWRAWCVRAGLIGCLIAAGVSLGTRQAHAIAYGRVDVDINDVVVVGTSGTSIAGIGLGEDLTGNNDASLATSNFIIAANGSGTGVGEAPQAFVGNIVADQGENNIFNNTDPNVTNVKFARADNLFHLTSPTNTLISGGVNMDAVAESSIDAPSTFLETSNSLSVLQWSLLGFPTTDSNGGTRSLNVSFGWTRRAELNIDVGNAALSSASIDVQAGIILAEYRLIFGVPTPVPILFAPPSAFGSLIINPPTQLPGDAGISSTVSGTFSHTFTFTPNVAATGSYAVYGNFSLESTVTVAIPEPSTLTLLGLGVVGMATRIRRRRR